MAYWGNRMFTQKPRKNGCICTLASMALIMMLVITTAVRKD